MTGLCMHFDFFLMFLNICLNCGISSHLKWTFCRMIIRFHTGASSRERPEHCGVSPAQCEDLELSPPAAAPTALLRRHRGTRRGASVCRGPEGHSVHDLAETLTLSAGCGWP